MAKLPHQTQPPPVDNLDAATKAYADSSGGGGSPLAAAQGDYVTAVLNTLHDSVIDQPVEFEVEVQQRGSLTLDTVNHKITGLKAGRTYLLLAQIRIQVESGSFCFWDLTNDVRLGGTDIGCQPIHVTRSDNTSSTPIMSYVATPTEDIEVEVRCLSGGTTDVHPGWTYFQVIEIGAVQANVIGGLEFLDIIEVGADTTSVSFGAGGDGLLGTLLDGDVDETYIIEYFLPTTSAGAEIDLRPNGATTNMTAARHYGGTSTAGITYTKLAFFDTASARQGAGRIEFHAKSGKSRNFLCLAALSAGDIFTENYGGFWNETVSNVATLDIVSDVANQIKQGARFVLFRRTSRNVRADSASTYERNVEATVAQGTNSETEYTTGHASRQGSAIAVSASLNDTVTAGSITINLKIAGSTVLTATLDTTNTSFDRAIENIGVHKVAPGDEIVVGIATTGLTTTGGGTPGITVNAMLVADGLVSQPTDVVGETILSAASDTISVTGLDGDAHGDYLVDFHLFIIDGSTHNIDVEPNGPAPSSIFSRWFSNFGGATAQATEYRLVGGLNTQTSRELIGRIQFSAARTQGGVSKKRSMRAETMLNYTASPYGTAYNTVGYWDDATANLTQLDIVDSVAGGFAAGSRVTVRRA